MVAHTLSPQARFLHVSPPSASPLPGWYNAFIMITWSSPKLIHRNDANVYFQMRQVVDQVATTALVLVRRASEYGILTFLVTSSPMDNFPSSRSQDFFSMIPEISKMFFQVIISCRFNTNTRFNLLSSGLTPGYTLGTVLGTLGGIALLVILYLIFNRRRFFPDGYEEESYVASDTSPTPAQEWHTLVLRDFQE